MWHFSLLLLGAHLCVGLPRQNQQDVEVMEGTRVNCKVTAVVRYPSTSEEGAVPTVECTNKCKFNAESKDQTYFVGYVYRHFERLENEYGLMVQIRYNKGTNADNSCTLVPATGDEELISTHIESTSPCVMTTVPPTTLATTLPPTTGRTSLPPHTTTIHTTLYHHTPPTTQPTTVPVTHDPKPTTLPTTVPPTTVPTTTLPLTTAQPTTLPPTTVPTTTPSTTTAVPTTTTTTTTTTPSTTTTTTTTPPTTTTTPPTTTTTTTTTPPTTTTTTATPCITTTTTTAPPTTTTTPPTTTTTTTTTTPPTTTTTTAPTTTSWVCGSDWVLIGRACFHLSTALGDWSSGQTYCAGLGATLASVRSQEEQDGLEGLIDGNAWIGLHDMHSEGDHLWEDQTALSYSNWAPGQPDNSGTFLWWGSGEDCVEMNTGYSFKWNDQDCDNQNIYICRRGAELQG